MDQLSRVLRHRALKTDTYEKRTRNYGKSSLPMAFRFPPHCSIIVRLLMLLNLPLETLMPSRLETVSPYFGISSEVETMCMHGAGCDSFVPKLVVR
jgi:hypothetical protein